MTAEIFQKLAAPFPPDRVSWRVGSTNRRNFEAGKAQTRKGQALAYVDARDVMERFDDVLGPGYWQCRYVPMPNGTTCCEVGIAIGNASQWIWKANGAGATGDVNKEAEREMAEKGGYSDAFKRAAVLWGVARYLYDLENPWVELDEYWNIPKDAHSRLRNILTGNAGQSAYAARRDGEFPRIEAAIRSCTTLDALQTVWKREQEAIASLPAGWRKHIEEEKNRMKSVLSAELAA